MNTSASIILQVNKPIEQGEPFHAQILIPSGTTFESVSFQIRPNSIESANRVLCDAVQRIIQSHYEDKPSVSKSELLGELVEAGRTALEVILDDNQTRREILAKLRTLGVGTTLTIMFDRQEPIFMPWELLVHDQIAGDPLYRNFWGYRYVICRKAFSGYANFEESGPTKQPRLALLASEGLFYVDNIKRPYLSNLADQDRIIYTDFSTTIDKAGTNATRQQRRLNDLLNGKDLQIANFACYMIPVSDQIKPFKILLHRDIELVLEDIRPRLTLSENKSVIVLNLRSKENNKNTNAVLCENQHFHWIDAFLESGASGVISANSEVPDIFAAIFATEMYQNLVAGSTIGDALLKTRQDMLQRHQNLLGLVYTLYVHPDKQIFMHTEKDKSTNTTPSKVPDDSYTSQWVVEYDGIPYSINKGVHRDIIKGVQMEKLDGIFVGITKYREKLWAILSRPQDDTAYHCTANLWKELWIQEEGLPPFNMIQLLAKKQYISNELYKGYRDHVVHSFLVYLLGLHIYYSNPRIQDAMSLLGEPSEFFKAWKIAALFHDIGYYLNIKDTQATVETQQMLLERLQEFVKNPLQLYGKAHKNLKLQLADEDEKNLRRAGNPRRWELGTITDLRKPFASLKGHILDILDDLVKEANLADHSQKRYCFRYDQYAQNVDTDKHSACDDHGMISAMILLGQYDYFQHYTDAICKPKILKQMTGLSSEARDWLPTLPEKVKQCRKNVHQAAAAIALHNVHVTGWKDPGWSKARSEPYFLTLDHYKLSLKKTPLAWLLALADSLQCWDRPSWTEAPQALEDCTIKQQQIRITTASTHDKLIIDFLTDEYKGTPRSRFRKLINELDCYLDDTDILADGMDNSNPIDRHGSDPSRCG